MLPFLKSRPQVGVIVSQRKPDGDKEEKGMEGCPWIFAHTRARGGVYQKGDPKKSFKKQWENMLRGLGYWEDWGTSPTD